MDNDAKITPRQIGGASRYACYQHGELRDFPRHSTEQMGHRAEATRISRFERLPN
jgi:hypothetical protein